MRWAVAVLVIAACGDRTAEREAQELAAMTMTQALAQVRAIATDCAGFARALDRTSKSGKTRRLLAGMVHEAIDSARPHCPDLRAAIAGNGTAEQLARARLADEQPADALAALADDASEPAIRWRRAELLDRLGRPDAALAELAEVAQAEDEDARGQRWLLEVAVAARSGQPARAARVISDALVPDRPRLAFRAAAETPPAGLAALATAAVEPELATAAGDRLEATAGAAAALTARQRAVDLGPRRAEHHDALARALLAARRIDEALAAWTRAADLAPAQPAFRLAPIRALVAAGDPARARDHALALAEAARGRQDADALVTASAGASAAGDAVLAVALAREAHSHRPEDGRLAFAVAGRLVEAGDRTGAIAAYAELLVCGSHGKPYHRHEVSAKLVALATDPAAGKAILAAVDRLRSPCGTAARQAGACESRPYCKKPADAADLATYVAALRKQLAPS